MLRFLIVLVVFVGLNALAMAFFGWWSWQARAFANAGEWLYFVAMFGILWVVGYVCLGRDGRAEVATDWRRLRADPGLFLVWLRGRDQR
jgi:hypothetical protein